MRATCPNSSDHKRFVTPIHQMVDAEVDETGDVIDVVEELEVSFGPNPGNIWTCTVCGAEATVE